MTIARFGKIVPVQGDVLRLIGWRLTRGESLLAELPDAERLANMREGRDSLCRLTGVDFGYDVVAWHLHLVATTGERGHYTHPYGYSGVRSAVAAAATDAARLRLAAVLAAEEPGVPNPAADTPMPVRERLRRW